MLDLLVPLVLLERMAHVVLVVMLALLVPQERMELLDPQVWLVRRDLLESLAHL